MDMTGRQVAQGALFYGFRLDDHVPADHLLRRINGCSGAVSAFRTATANSSRTC
jgi:hypothetical protein